MSSSQVLPADFYSGRRQARRIALVFLLLVIGTSGILTASRRLDVLAILGPHVARSEWAFTMTGVRQLNSQGLTGAGVTVCVVDTGIDMLHPDFSRLHLIAWRDLVNLRTTPYDDNGHGTAMAGLIAADGSLRGVAPRVSMIAVKVLNSVGLGSPQNVADGIAFCLDPYGNGTRGADIVSLSLGGVSTNFFDITVFNKVAYAVSRGVFVVVAAGNDPQADDVSAAAQVPLAIAVGAVDSNGVKASFSSIGAVLNRTSPDQKPEITAPGVQLVSTAPSAHYVTVTGTSPATAIVAGILALILEARPGLRPSGVTVNIVSLKTALMLGAAKALGQFLPHDPWYGYGIVNGPATLAML